MSKKMLIMPDYQPLQRYKHFNVSRCCTIRYGISCYKQPSCLLQPLANIIPL